MTENCSFQNFKEVPISFYMISLSTLSNTSSEFIEFTQSLHSKGNSLRIFKLATIDGFKTIFL